MNLKLSIVLTTLCRVDFGLMSCSHDELENTTKSEITGSINSSLDVTLDDVSKVISSYIPEKSRAGSYSVTTKYGTDGQPSFYIINFEDDGGFVLLSATKTASPVLAYSDKGYFSEDFGLHPVNAWINQTQQYIAYTRTLPNDSVKDALHEWQKLLYTSTIGQSVPKTAKSRSNYISDDEYQQLMRLVNEARSNWEAQGCRTYAITEVIENDEQWSQYIQSYVQQQIYPLYEDYWDEFSFIVEHDEVVTSDTGVLFTSKWRQGHPYNAYCYLDDYPTMLGLVGCAPLAVAQIMSYYEYPKSFNWELIKQEGDAPAKIDAIAKFLREVGVKCKAKYLVDKDNTGQFFNLRTEAYIDDCCKALRAYGYEASTSTEGPIHVPYFVSAKYDALDGYPAGAHAWVIAGEKNYQGTHYYDYWCLTDKNIINCLEKSHETYSWDHWSYVIWGVDKFEGIIPVNKDGWYRNYDKYIQHDQPLYKWNYINIKSPNF